MNNVYNGIIIIIFVFLFGGCLISNHKLNTISEEYNNLLKSKSEIIDSLSKTNLQKENNIILLEESIIYLEDIVDSIQNKYHEVSDEKFIVSNNLTSSVNLLRRNLQCVEL